MFNITLDPKWILQKLGLDQDPELVGLVTQLMAQISQRGGADKKTYVKSLLRKALETR